MYFSRSSAVGPELGGGPLNTTALHHPHRFVLHFCPSSDSVGASRWCGGTIFCFHAKPSRVLGHCGLEITSSNLSLGAKAGALATARPDCIDMLKIRLGNSWVQPTRSHRPTLIILLICGTHVAVAEPLLHCHRVLSYYLCSLLKSHFVFVATPATVPPVTP